MGHGHGEHSREYLLLLWGGLVCLTLQSLHPQPAPEPFTVDEPLTAEVLKRPRCLPALRPRGQVIWGGGGATVELDLSETASPLVAREP